MEQGILIVADREIVVSYSISRGEIFARTRSSELEGCAGLNGVLVPSAGTRVEVFVRRVDFAKRTIEASILGPATWR